MPMPDNMSLDTPLKFCEGICVRNKFSYQRAAGIRKDEMNVAILLASAAFHTADTSIVSHTTTGFGAND